MKLPDFRWRYMETNTTENNAQRIMQEVPREITLGH